MVFSTIELLENRRLLSSTPFVVRTTVDDPLNTVADSLREVIKQVNADTAPGQDTISFEIPFSGVQTISLLAALPTLKHAVILDGTSQTGYKGTPLIQLSGTSAGAGVDGLDIAGGDSTVEGLAINNFKGAGINITAAGNNTIINNYIGVSPNGAQAAPNNEGVVVQSDNNLIGLPGSKNVISGNSLNGIRVTGNASAPADRNAISNNFVGTDSTGEIAIGNNVGISLDNVSNTLVNGNIVSGNNFDGIDLSNSVGVSNQVQANHIGVDLTGTLALGNAVNGISITNSGGALVHDPVANTDTVVRVLIGGSQANGNVISANANGVVITGGTYVTVAGNDIGTDSAGAGIVDLNGNSLGNSGNGVDLESGSHDNTIGGTTTDQRNLIAGGFGNGVQISTGGTAKNLVTGNYIGTDESGTVALGGYGDGVYVTSAGTTISNNLISGSAGGSGVYLKAAATVQGNLIGTQADGITPLPNVADGVYIAASGSLIGGAGALGNIIAFNGVNGINVFSGVQNAIHGNSIFGNTALGIDLGGDGVTLNGPAKISRAGANNLLNHPVISTVTIIPTGTAVSGTFTGLASTTYTIELFSSNSPPDALNSGQGRTYLGSALVTTDANGMGTFSVAVGALPGGQPFVTSTATDSAGNTSEFSNTVMVGVGAPQATTTTKIYTSNPTVTVGNPVTFTATVLRSGTATPGGTVTFKEVFSDTSTMTLGSPVAFSGSSVSITVSSLSVGPHNIIAVYSGDNTYAGSTSDPLVETVTSTTATISGSTFRDTTGDGLSGDDGAMAGVTVNIYRDVNKNKTLDSGDGAPVAHVTTDANGAYSFANLPAGRYFVQEVTPTGYIRTAPALSSYYTLNANAGSVYTSQDFDNYMLCNDRQWVSCIAYSVNGSNCWIPDLRGHIHEGDTVKVKFTVAYNHTATLTLVSYTAPGSSFDANKASLQSVYQYATGTFTAGCHTMQVTIPKCYFQVDFVCGDYIDRFGPAGSNVFYSAQNRLISADNGGIHTQLLSLLGAVDVSALNT